MKQRLFDLDADLLAWKRQYANIGLREQNIMSNSADDLSQLIDRIPYQFEVFGQDYNDPDDGKNKHRISLCVLFLYI